MYYKYYVVNFLPFFLMWNNHLRFWMLGFSWNFSASSCVSDKSPLALQFRPFASPTAKKFPFLPPLQMGSVAVP